MVYDRLTGLNVCRIQLSLLFLHSVILILGAGSSVFLCFCLHLYYCFLNIGDSPCPHRGTWCMNCSGGMSITEHVALRANSTNNTRKLSKYLTVISSQNSAKPTSYLRKLCKNKWFWAANFDYISKIVNTCYLCKKVTLRTCNNDTNHCVSLQEWDVTVKKAAGNVTLHAQHRII